MEQQLKKSQLSVLGFSLTINCHGQWRVQINRIKTKLARGTGLLSKLCYLLTILVYSSHSVIQSHINYEISTGQVLCYFGWKSLEMGVLFLKLEKLEKLETIIYVTR